jgi:hypothetical protein
MEKRALNFKCFVSVYKETLAMKLCSIWVRRLVDKKNVVFRFLQFLFSQYILFIF